MKSLGVDLDSKDIRFPCNALTWPSLAKTWLIGVAIQYLGISSNDPARLLRGRGCKMEEEMSKSEMDKNEQMLVGLLRSRIIHGADKIIRNRNTKKTSTIVNDYVHESTVSTNTSQLVF